MDSVAALSIHRTQDGYRFQLECPTASLSLSGRSTHAPWVMAGATALDSGLRAQLEGASDAAAELLRIQHASASPPATSRDPPVDEPLRRLGGLLFNLLLPAPLQETLQKLPEDLPLILTTDDTELPWELLHDGAQYLALNRPLGRRLSSAVPARHEPTPERMGRSFLCISNPTEDLPETDVEIEQLMDAFDTAPEIIDATFLSRSQAARLEVLQALASGDYDIIHYSGHARPGALLLADGELTAQDIQSALRGRPFIFLNACRSAEVQENLLSPPLLVTPSPPHPSPHAPQLPYAGLTAQNLAAAFVLGGATGFIGTLWQVFDASSREFAEWFYAMVLNGLPVGEALRRTRERMRKAHPGDPLWASFVLYGDPTLRIAGLERRERRPVTVLVARLSGLLQLYDTLDLEAAAEVEDQALHQLSQVARRYGGRVRGPLTDILGVRFGVPDAYEDDAERAIRTALDMARRLQTFNQRFSGTIRKPIGLRMGISTGQVIGRQMVSPAGLDYRIAGDVVDLAAGLSAHADEGQVVVDDATHRLAERAFSFESLGVLPIAEGTRQISAYHVREAKGALSIPTEMVGRDSELTQLEGWWREAMSGQGRLVGVVGAAGVGKTCLLQAFREDLTGVGARQVGEQVRLLTRSQSDTSTELSAGLPRPYWIAAACQSYDQTTTYALLSQVIRGLARIASDDDEPTRRSNLEKLVRGVIHTTGPPAEGRFGEGLALLGQVVGLSVESPAVDNLDPELRQKKLAGVVQAVLAHQAAQQPTIVVLEDMQWADEASLTVMDQVVGAVGRMPVLVLAAYRPDWSHAWTRWGHYRQLSLGELGEDAQHALLAKLLGVDEPPARLIQIILSRTGGNPFFIEEVVKSLQETEVLRRQNGAWTISQTLTDPQLPDTLQRTLLVRFDRLPADTQQVLQVASVAGLTFAPALLTQVLGPLDPPVDYHLAELESRDFVYSRWDTGDYVFRHALIQETAYRSVPTTQQRVYHRRIGRALEESYAGREAEVLELLALHYYRSLTMPGTPDSPGAVIVEADPVDLTRATRYLAMAGARANHRYAARQAITHYHRALQVAEHLPADDEAWVTECHTGLGDAHNVLGDFDTAIEAYSTAFDRLTAKPSGTEDRCQAADLARRIGRLLGWQARYDEALHWMEQGLQVLDGDLDEASAATVAMIHVHTGTVYYFRGQYDAAVEHIERGLGIVEGTDQTEPMAHGYNVLGAVYDAKGERDRAVEHYQKSLSLWEQLEDTYQAARVEDNVGVVYFHLGRWAEAAESHRHALAFFGQIEDRDQMVYPCLNLGNVYLCQGNWGQAEELFERARALSAAVGNQRMLALSYTNLGLVSLEREDWRTARTHLEQSLALLEQHEIEDFLAETQAAFGRLCLGEGDAAAALEWGQKALDAAQVLEMRLEEGQAHRVLGMAHWMQGDLAQAEEHLRHSLTVLESVEHRYEIGRTLVQLTRVSRNARHPNEALNHLNRAMAIFEELGAQADIDEAQRLRSNWTDTDAGQR